MSLKNKKNFIILNLIFPGLAQLKKQKYIIGSLIIVISLCAIFWMLWELIFPIVSNIANMLDNEANKSGLVLQNISFVRIISALVLLISIWIFSIVELIVNKK